MLAQDFVRKWQAGATANDLGERAGAQAHFIDLCRVLGVAEPGDPERYCFERGVTKTGSLSARTDGFADVWLRGHFAWEYKAPGKSQEGALRQLMMYALPLESPPLLVVSDRLRIEVHTHFTGTPSERHAFVLEDITRPEVQQRLRALWTAPDEYKPRKTNRDITEVAARAFAGTAERLRAAGVAGEAVSHLLTQCVFSFFAEDVGLLPGRLFERLVGVQVAPERLRAVGRAVWHHARRWPLRRRRYRLVQRRPVPDRGRAGAVRRRRGGAQGRQRAELERHRRHHLRHPVRARPGPGQAQPAWRQFHRPRHHHAARRAGGAASAAGRVGRPQGAHRSGVGQEQTPRRQGLARRASSLRRFS